MWMMPFPSARSMRMTAEEVFDLIICQRRGGLVHDQHFRIVRKGLGDFHHLLFGDGQAAYWHGRIDIHAQAFKQLPRAPVEGGVVEEKQRPPLLAADEYVLRHGKVVHQVQFLMDHHDAQALTVAHAAYVHFLSMQEDAALVLGVHAREDFHQRGLARAVLAHERMHLSGVELEGTRR